MLWEETVVILGKHLEEGLLPRGWNETGSMKSHTGWGCLHVWMKGKDI